MASALTIRGIDGVSIPAVQPVAESVASSPFTVTSGASVTIGVVTGGPGVQIYTTEPIHIRFDGEAATSDEMLVPSGQLVSFPIASGDDIRVIADDVTATVYVAMVRPAPTA